jgi:hypothetical protein
LVLAIAVTLLVVLVDASVKSRSAGPVQTLDADTWIDRALPIIAASSAQGQTIANLQANAIHMPAQAIAAQLSQTTAAAKQSYQQALALRAPSNVAGPAGLLTTCLLVRSQAVDSFAKAMNAALVDPPPTSSSDPNIQAMISAGQDFQIADRSYQLFLADMPKLGVTLPASQWYTTPGFYQPGGLQIFLTTLRNSTNLNPVHQLDIAALSTNPAPVSAQGTMQILPPTTQLGVSIVVADTGNQSEPNLTVTATITPALYGPSQTVRDFVSLVPGGASSMTIGPLYLPQGAPVTLTAAITPPTGSTTPPASATITIEVPSPNPPSTSAPTAAPTSTTLPKLTTTTASTVAPASSAATAATRPVVTVPTTPPTTHPPTTAPPTTAARTVPST